MSNNPYSAVFDCDPLRNFHAAAFRCMYFVQVFFSENIVCVAISQVRQEMHLENLAQQYLAYLIKKMCWDDMETKGNIHICV